VWEITNVNSIVIWGAKVLIALILIIFILALIRPVHSKIKWINRKLSAIQNIIALLSILVAVSTVWITSAISEQHEKHSNLEAVMVDSYEVDWNKEGRYDNLPSTSEIEKNHGVLPYIIDEDGCFCYVNCGNNKRELYWNVSVENSGNIAAKNVTIEISIEHYSFFSSTQDNYILIDHYPHTTVFRCISRSYDSIRPNTRVVLPRIPLSIVQKLETDDTGYKEGEPTNLLVTIYEDNEIQKEYSFPCKSYNDVFPSERCPYESTKVDRECIGHLEYLSNVYQGNDLGTMPRPLSHAECMEIIKSHPEIPFEDYRKAYNYFLDKLSAYNPSARENAQRNCLFFGRMYYLSLGEEDIELKISNDISSYSKVDISS